MNTIKGKPWGGRITQQLAQTMAVQTKRESGSDASALDKNARTRAVQWFMTSRHVGAADLADVARELMERGTNWNPLDNYGVVQLSHRAGGGLSRITGAELQVMSKAVLAIAEEAAGMQARGELPAVVGPELE